MDSNPNNDATVSNANDLPTDTVSAISWMPSQQNLIFAAGSWDKTIRLYEFVAQNYNKALNPVKSIQLEDPCLSIAWKDDCTAMFAGLVNNYVAAIDVASGKVVNIGAHESGVRDVYWVPAINMVVSLGFDKQMKFWDLNSQQPAAQFNLGHKIFCSDMYYPYMVCGLADENILIIDFNNLQGCLNKQNLDYIESPLGKTSQLTCVSFFADGSGIGTASHDGRANLSKVQPDNMGKYKLNNIMTFKCHKVDHSQTNQFLYPVHAMGFNPRSSDFLFTAGGDGNLIFWDYTAKNKITGFSFNGTPVTKAKCDYSGNLLAYATGYDWAQGIEGYGKFKTKIACHVVDNSELKYVKK